MKWRRLWPKALSAAILITSGALAATWDPNTTTLHLSSGWSSERKLAFREQTRQLWYHGFDNYMTFAFPLDELTPLSCSGQGPDWNNPENIAKNDVAGNFSLTLIDVLDTFIILDDRSGFEKAVRNIIGWVSFDVNTKPQVFETTIRVLGGLLSGHIFASKVGHPFYLQWYRGELLTMAYDLGKRLLPAFVTLTGIPYARINLRHGIVEGETAETCTAGAGSLILEFATLSRLTGDDRFEKVAYKAFFALWNRKSDIGLVGNTIDTRTGFWTYPEVTGIGAGIDSFYEYALKWYVISGEVEFLDVWEDSYAALMRYSRATDGYWYRNVNIYTGDVAYFTVDSLSAFWPGLQVLAGDVQNAIRSHFIYWNLWRRHSGLPEVWDINFKTATSHQYPLRPEFIESTWYLYRATRDPFYLDVGERILHDIINRAKVDCGLTGIQDIRTNKRDDRMESFALSETLKYLYLLFDENNQIHHDDSNYVFTTEGHLLTLPRDLLRPMPPARRKMRHMENHQCPAYRPFMRVYDNLRNETGLVQGIRSRSDVDYARELVNLLPDNADRALWTEAGWCEKPKVELFSYDFILSPSGKIVPEDVSPSSEKLSMILGGYVIHNITGIRTHIVRRLDGKGYDITKLGPHAVKTGQLVYINDSALFLTPLKDSKDSRKLDVQLRFFVDVVDPLFKITSLFKMSNDLEALVTGFPGLFGADLLANPKPGKKPLRFGHGGGVAILRDGANLLGCLPYGSRYEDGVLLVYRGECTFLEKLVHARDAGAAGVVVISDNDLAINPSAGTDEIDAAGDISDVSIVVLTRTAGKIVVDMMDLAVARGIGRVMLALDPERQAAVSDGGRTSEQSNDSSQDVRRVLYLNGHPLLNTRLLV